MRKRLPRFSIEGDGGAFGQWANALETLGKLTGRPPVRVSYGANAPVVELDNDPATFVTLSGTGPSYTGTQVFPTATNSWATLSGAPTIACTEVNGVTGLSGKVVRIRPEAGEWRFRYVRYAGCHPLTVIDEDCVGNPRSGSSITATLGGTTVGPVTSNGLGHATLTLPSSGTWTITSVKSGTYTQSAQYAYTCASGGTLTLSWDSLVPSSATLTSGGQSHTFTRSTDGSGHYVYLGYWDYPGASYHHDIAGVCTSYSTSLIYIDITCSSAAYTAYMVACPSPGSISYANDLSSAGESGVNNTGTITSISLSPFLITGTWASAWDGTPTTGTPAPGLVGTSWTLS